MLLHLLFPNHHTCMVGHTALGAWQRVTQSLCLSYIVGKGLLFQVWFHPMTWLTLNLWWALNLLILVKWLGIRWMSSPCLVYRVICGSFPHLSWVDIWCDHAKMASKNILPLHFYWFLHSSYCILYTFMNYLYTLVFKELYCHVLLAFS